ncbi:MAG: amidohydrolase family protein [Chloroflexi bacterium]|nr:amidohydrolase family protein [Chloroflexota bacterium]
MHAILIKGGNLHDGTSFIGVGDVLVADDRIEAVGTLSVPETFPSDVIDATGCVVAPGFIECHNMTQQVENLDGNDALNLLAQGVTTCVIGNCGMAGVLAAADGFVRKFQILRDSRLGLNVGSLVGHNTLRRYVVSGPSQPSSPEEVGTMERILEEALDAGYLGFSSGLMYAPGRSASQAEMRALATVVGCKDKVYTSHIRDDGDHLRAAVVEALDTAQQGQVKLVISHLKAAGRANWGSAIEMTEVIEARRRDQEAYVSFYPYTATSTILRAVIPESILSSVDGNVERLRYNEDDARTLAAAGLQRYADNGWGDVVVVSSRVGSCLGKSIAEIAGDAPPYAAVLDILQQDVNTRVVFYNIASDAELQEIAKRPWAMVASDGYVYPTGCEEATHPRNYGAFARVVSDYVRKLGIMTIDEFIRRVTTLPAKVFGIQKRGAVKPGNFADIAVFRPDEMQDLSDYQTPWRPAIGVRCTIVNGRVAYKNGKATSAFSGRCVS